MSAFFGEKAASSDGLILYYNPSDPKNYLLDEVEVLLVGGGGGGSENQYDDGAGGGGGGFVQRTVKVSSSTSYAITVGNGGSGPSWGSGGNTSAFGLIAYGGGGGSSHRSSAGGSINGASGGGSGGQYSADTPIPGRAVYGDQGFDGGFSISYGGGGGGGAGGPGQGSLQFGFGGMGGKGRASSISGRLRYYGAGGGGFGYAGVGVGGIGGAGYGTTPEANTGSGGNGGKTTGTRSQDGASGVVIVRYPGPQKATGGNTISYVDGYTIHTFTSTGNSTFTTLGLPSNGSTVYGLYDLSNNLNSANTLGLSFAPTYSTSASGTLVFDGVDDIIQIKRSETLNNLKSGLGGNGYTVLVWARSTSPTGQWRKLIGNDDGENYVDLYQSPGGFYHQECGSTLYVDAVQVSNSSYFMPNTGYHLWGATNFNSGVIVNPVRDFGIFNEPDRARAYQLAGNLGEIFIYNRVLSLSEISEVFSLTRSRYGI